MLKCIFNMAYFPVRCFMSSHQVFTFYCVRSDSEIKILWQKNNWRRLYEAIQTFHCNKTSITRNTANDKSLRDEYNIYDLMKLCYIQTKLGQCEAYITVLLICLTSHFVLSFVPITCRCTHKLIIKVLLLI